MIESIAVGGCLSVGYILLIYFWAEFNKDP